MSTVLIARFKNKKDAFCRKAYEEIQKRSGCNGRRAWEDIELAKLIDEGMKEPGQVPLKAILEKLKK